MVHTYKNLIITSFKSLSLLILIQCQSDSCFNDAGPEGNLNIETGYFKEVDFNGMFDVTLVQDSVYFVEFEGGKNMLQYVRAQNTDSVLWIENTNECLFRKDYKKIKLIVHFKDIDLASFILPCKIRSQNPLTDDFALIIPGEIADLDIELNNNNFLFYNHKNTAGVYIFRGKSTNCHLMGYYTALVDASQLITTNLIIENSSIVDFYVNAVESLTVKIYNRGNIYYYGNPVVVIDTIAGKGNVYKAN